MASNALSGEIPWSLLHRMAKPVSIVSGFPPFTGNRKIRPSRLKRNALPSRVQFGASNRPDETYTAVRSPESTGTVSKKLYSVTGDNLAAAFGGAVVISTFEKAARSTT